MDAFSWTLQVLADPKEHDIQQLCMDMKNMKVLKTYQGIWMIGKNDERESGKFLEGARPDVEDEFPHRRNKTLHSLNFDSRW